MKLAKIGLAVGLLLAAGTVTVPQKAEAGRSVGVYTPYFSFYVGPRYKKRYYKKRYYRGRYKRRYYYGRPYYYYGKPYKKRRYRHYRYRYW